MQDLNHRGKEFKYVLSYILVIVVALWIFIGVFEGNRLIIVITKFDQQSESAELSDTEEEITQEDAKEQTYQFVREICPSANISHDDVLPVSGRWAYHARLLASSCPHHALHGRYQENVKKCLRVVPNPTCGQGEDLNTSLDEFEDNELSTKLEKVSGITVLEERYSKIYTYVLYQHFC